MDQILEKLTSLFGFSANQPPHEDKMNKALQAELEKLRNVDPQTQRQWMRLQKAIVENAAEAPSKSRSMPRFAFATSVVAFAIVGVYLYFTSLQPAPERFSTVRGQQKEVVLNDGSQVTLNYATELVVQKLRPGDPRRLSLSGEAFFRVEKNNAPFIVSTSFAEVHVVGTEFNVRAREDALEVAVIRGVVNVRVVKDGKDSTLVL
ncbi:MAG: FecR domain-containing protein, partial [Ignavibacteriales bacterium]|nr:FecR domain-containing protein [Ignavibacteriales bacterium]